MIFLGKNQLGPIQYLISSKNQMCAFGRFPPEVINVNLISISGECGVHIAAGLGRLEMLKVRETCICIIIITLVVETYNCIITIIRIISHQIQQKTFTPWTWHIVGQPVISSKVAVMPLYIILVEGVRTMVAFQRTKKTCQSLIIFNIHKHILWHLSKCNCHAITIVIFNDGNLHWNLLISVIHFFSLSSLSSSF